jgi:hypothetical protein
MIDFAKLVLNVRVLPRRLVLVVVLSLVRSRLADVSDTIDLTLLRISLINTVPLARIALRINCFRIFNGNPSKNAINCLSPSSVAVMCSPINCSVPAR